MNLQGKKGIVFGVANHRSFAWAIAKAAGNAGAQVGVAYQNERLKDNAEKLTSELTDSKAFQCDLNIDSDCTRLRAEVLESFGKIDFMVHCVAFALREELTGRFIDTSREGFRIALETSAYSFVAAAKTLEPAFNPGTSLLTLSYLGSERVLPNYNVMGVAKAALEATVRYMAYDLGVDGTRVNALSPGPVNTLAARGISGFNEILKHVSERAPLKRNIDQEDVAETAIFFLSDASKNITGEVLYIDAGYNIVGM